MCPCAQKTSRNLTPGIAGRLFSPRHKGGPCRRCQERVARHRGPNDGTGRRALRRALLAGDGCDRDGDGGTAHRSSDVGVEPANTMIAMVNDCDGS